MNKLCFLITAVALVLSSCATTDQPYALAAVGPPPGLISHGKEGTLQVFTATSTRNDGGTFYYPHSAYRIYELNGNFVRFVRNHAGTTDQRPEPVGLSAGDYYIIAKSEGCGVVKLPIVIKGSQLTVIYLDQTVMREAKAAHINEVVTFPNGHIVGWKAEIPAAK
jgi:hypothetical protein